MSIQPYSEKRSHLVAFDSDEISFYPNNAPQVKRVQNDHLEPVKVLAQQIGSAYREAKIQRPANIAHKHFSHELTDEQFMATAVKIHQLWDYFELGCKLGMENENLRRFSATDQALGLLFDYKNKKIIVKFNQKALGIIGSGGFNTVKFGYDCVNHVLGGIRKRRLVSTDGFTAPQPHNIDPDLRAFFKENPEFLLHSESTVYPLKLPQNDFCEASFIPFLKKGSLKDFHKKHPDQPIFSKEEIMDLVNGLVRLHQFGASHNDISGGNILKDEQGIRIGDLDGACNYNNTASKKWLGNPRYADPTNYFLFLRDKIDRKMRESQKLNRQSDVVAPLLDKKRAQANDVLALSILLYQYLQNDLRACPPWMPNKEYVHNFIKNENIKRCIPSTAETLLKEIWQQMFDDFVEGTFSCEEGLLCSMSHYNPDSRPTMEQVLKHLQDNPDRFTITSPKKNGKNLSTNS